MGRGKGGGMGWDGLGWDKARLEGKGREGGICDIDSHVLCYSSSMRR